MAIEEVRELCDGELLQVAGGVVVAGGHCSLSNLYSNGLLDGMGYRIMTCGMGSSVTSVTVWANPNDNPYGP